MSSAIFYIDTSLHCKIIAPPSVQPTGKRWPDVEGVIKVGELTSLLKAC